MGERAKGLRSHSFSQFKSVTYVLNEYNPFDFSSKDCEATNAVLGSRFGCQTVQMCGRGGPGRLKTVAGLRKTRHRGVARVGWMFTFALAAYNLVRMRNLVSAAA